jgi:hypothetical protein
MTTPEKIKNRIGYQLLKLEETIGSLEQKINNQGVL